MTIKGIVVILAAVGLMGVALSCRREPAKPASTEPAPSPSASPSLSPSAPAAGAVRPAPVLPGTNLEAAIAARHRVERELRENDPLTQSLFVRLTDAEAAYTAWLLKFGAYSIPAAERDAAMMRLAKAMEAGDASESQAAEQAMREADERAEAAAASLRSGHPPIQKAYDDWMEARRAYADRVKKSETVSTADARLSEAMDPSRKQDVNDRVKEN